MKKTIAILMTVSALSLSACGMQNDTEAETTSVSSEETTVSSEVLTEPAKTTATDIITERESEFTTSISDSEEVYTVFWEENGEEKYQEYTGYKTPYTIIHTVLEKYYGEDMEFGIYDADWMIFDYPEEAEDGFTVELHFMAELDLSEGYSAIIGEDDLQKVTASIAKSFLESYDLDSIVISELGQDLLFMERE